MSLKYESVIRQMTLEEKARMMSGKNTWQSVDYPKYHIPSIMMSDGPHGMRTQNPDAGDHLGLGSSMPATCFPTAATVANSWDERLAEELGNALAEEAISMGVHVILGPGLNIKRSPLCGRNFEYFSEDPYLSGKMAAAYVRGIQSRGIAACPKHFAVNSQELRRMANNSVLDERTLREIYLTGFEIAVKEGKAKAMMSSYNEVNGVYANENKHLLQEILVDEWGFDGYVVSDWGASNDHALGVKNGSHLEMPGTGKAGKREILQAIEKGFLTEEELDKRLDEFLNVIFQLNETAAHAGNKGFDVEAHHALARKTAEQSIVLLKNEDRILPIKQAAKVAVIGDFAKTPRYQGAGSSLVNPTKEPESILNCIADSGLNMVAYAQGYRRNEKPDQGLIEDAVKVAEGADAVLVFAGLDEINEAEGMDRPNLRMPQAQNELIDALTDRYSNVVVVLSAGSAIEMPWKDKVKAIVHGYLGGQAGASAMLSVLTGAVNPSGKLNETYPLRYEDTPAYAYYPGKERNSEYRESLFVGYRYYSSVGQKVSFPFGYGLSYTTFTYSNLTATAKEVRFRLKNTGERDGAEITQVYIGTTSDTVFRPLKELKGFRKVFLKAGEEKEVVIPLDDKAFRFFDVRTNNWETESGMYHIEIGASSEDTVLETDIMIHGTVSEGGYDRKELPDYFSGKVTEVEDAEFERLYGRKLPDGGWSGEIGLNDALCQLYYAKGWLGRFAYFVLTKLVKHAEKKGKPNLNLLFIYNIPIRGIAKMTGGIINKEMTCAITEMVNGHAFRGIGHFIRGFFVK
ncbi:MAG: glycoside hydrolase family 3 C-terminal domain-containing protein [Lachnospiraceae bacterium]